MLKILARLIRDVDAAEDFDEALSVIVESVLDALKTKTCSIFLVDNTQGDFVLVATKGLNPQAVKRVRIQRGQGLIGLVVERDEPINVDDAPKHPSYLHVPDIQEENFLGFLAAPITHGGEVLGVIVVQQEEPRHFDSEEEAFLVTITAHLAAVFARAENSGDIKQFFSSVINYEDGLKGLPGAPGVGIGRGVVMYPLADLEAVPDRDADDIELEVSLFTAALNDARTEMKVLGNNIAQNLAEGEQELFQAYAHLLEDDDFSNEVIDEIRRMRQWAEGALRTVVKRYIYEFESMESVYLRERATDVRDLGQLVLSYLQKRDRSQMTFYDKTILVGEEITASNLASVPEGCLLGIVSVTGSSNSHVAILARAMKIPAVMGVGELPYAELSGEYLAVDGYAGSVYIQPSEKRLKEFEVLIQQQEALDKNLEKLHGLSAETTDQHRVGLFVNMGLETDVGLSLTAGAEGVGLYRTEVPFMTRDCFPSSHDQRKIYRQLLHAFSPLPVTMRTLDIGGDKQLPYFSIQEDNPFLGWRGLRISLDKPDMFLMQVRAMMRASADYHNLKILLPMVTDVSEVDRALVLIHRAYADISKEHKTIPMPQIGVMIEVPSAVYQARAIARRVDFLSVGSNDLTQYLLAVDRNNSQVAHLYDPLHPAVLRALSFIVESAHAENKPVSICGEMAGDPAAAILLLGMGFDSFSMSAVSLPRIKWLVRSFSLTEAKKILCEVLLKENSGDIISVLESALERAGLGSLIRTRLG